MKAVKVILVIIAVLFGTGLLAYQIWLKPQLDYASIAANYGAKKFCSCIFVADLTAEQCEADFSEDVSMATFIVEDNAARVEFLGGRISARAVHREDLGCTLQPDGGV
ncbi:MAG: hypothetical protein AAF926_07570 [Pseudomonadota bacterium]